MFLADFVTRLPVVKVPESMLSACILPDTIIAKSRHQNRSRQSPQLSINIVLLFELPQLVLPTWNKRRLSPQY
jgi:hypothetical protein